MYDSIFLLGIGIGVGRNEDALELESDIFALESE